MTARAASSVFPRVCLSAGPRVTRSILSLLLTSTSAAVVSVKLILLAIHSNRFALKNY